MDMMTRAERLNDLRRLRDLLNPALTDDWLGRVLDTLPNIMPSVWTETMRLATAEKSFPTRRKLVNLAVEAHKVKPPITQKVELLGQRMIREYDEEYGRERKRLIDAIQEHGLSPLDALPGLEGLARLFPHHAGGIQREIEIWRRNPLSWRDANSETLEDARRRANKTGSYARVVTEADSG